MKGGGEVESLYAKFHLNVFFLLASGGQRPQFSANFEFLGAPVPTPFIDKGQVWCMYYNRPTV